MLRFDYNAMENGQVSVTVVSEQENSHSLAGRLILEKEEFKYFKDACAAWNEDMKELFFKFENKGEKK